MKFQFWTVSPLHSLYLTLTHVWCYGVNIALSLFESQVDLGTSPLCHWKANSIKQLCVHKVHFSHLKWKDYYKILFHYIMYTHEIHLRESLPSFLLLRNVINFILHMKKKWVSKCDLPIPKIIALSTRWRCLYNPQKA